MYSGLIQVVIFGSFDHVCVCFVNPPDNPCRDPRSERSFGNFGAGSYERPGGDDCSRVYAGTVQQDSAHPDQDVIFHGSSVYYGPVADRYAIPHQDREAGIGMYQREILDVGVLSDYYFLIISPEHGAVPEA